MGIIGKRLSSYILLSAFCSSFVNSSAVNASEESKRDNNGTVYINHEKDPDKKPSSVLPVAFGVGLPSSAALVGASAYGANKSGLFSGSDGSSSESALERSENSEVNTMYMRKVVDEKKTYQSYLIGGDESKDIRYRGCSRNYSDGSKASVQIWSSMLQINHWEPVKGGGWISSSRGMRFESNERVDALVEEIYELRKRFEECDQSEEELIKEQIVSKMDELSDELFKIYVETREKNDGVKLYEVSDTGLVDREKGTGDESWDKRRMCLLVCILVGFIVFLEEAWRRVRNLLMSTRNIDNSNVRNNNFMDVEVVSLSEGPNFDVPLR